MKPKPVYFIPADAPIRKDCSWYNPHSLCRTCVYNHLQEPYCKTVKLEGFRDGGISWCEGYEEETMLTGRVSFIVP